MPHAVIYKIGMQSRATGALQDFVGVAGASVPELFEPMLRGPIRARSADGPSAQRHTAPFRRVGLVWVDLHWVG